MAASHPSVDAGRKIAHSHLLMLLAKLRAGTMGRAAMARLATVETARRANILAGRSRSGEWYMSDSGGDCRLELSPSRFVNGPGLSVGNGRVD
jgi:hypothetical protein